MYLGKVKYKQELHEGQHEAIIAPEVWQQVQTLLIHNSRNGGADVRNQLGSLLRGLLRCRACDCAMFPAQTTRRTRRYRYYVCSHAQKHGWATCPSKSVPAAEMERFVIEQIRGLGQDQVFTADVLSQMTEVTTEDRAALRDRERLALQELRHTESEIRRLEATDERLGSDARRTARQTELQDRRTAASGRLQEIQQTRRDSEPVPADPETVEQALQAFDPVWNAMTPSEQQRVLKLLVQRVDYDGSTGQVDITFYPRGGESQAESCSEGEGDE